jgi:hypothetical protein
VNSIFSNLTITIHSLLFKQLYSLSSFFLFLFLSFFFFPQVLFFFPPSLSFLPLSLFGAITVFYGAIFSSPKRWVGPEEVSSTSSGSSTVLDEQNRPKGVSSTASGSSTRSSYTDESLGSSQIPQHKKNSPESSRPESHHRVNRRERERE